MSKDQNGVFHPGKGKSSGANKEEGLGFQATAPEKLEEYLEKRINIQMVKMSLHQECL